MVKTITSYRTIIVRHFNNIKINLPKLVNMRGRKLSTNGQNLA